MTETVMSKRTFLGSAAALLGGLAIGGCSKGSEAAAETFEVTRTPEQWRAILTPAQFAVLRGEGTERPRSSPLNDEHRRGIYQCAGCALPVYESTAKFESGTGWPSFFTTIPGAFATSKDFRMIWPRTEYHCARCGGHQGHIFDDGPKPLGKRWCNNGVALAFVPKGQSLPALRS